MNFKILATNNNQKPLKQQMMTLLEGKVKSAPDLSSLILVMKDSRTQMCGYKYQVRERTADCHGAVIAFKMKGNQSLQPARWFSSAEGIV